MLLTFDFSTSSSLSSSSIMIRSGVLYNKQSSISEEYSNKFSYFSLKNMQYSLEEPHSVRCFKSVPTKYVFLEIRITVMLTG